MIWWIPWMILCAAMLAGCSGTAASSSARPEDNRSLIVPRHTYFLKDSHEVKGRQGVCTDGTYYYVSGSTSLTKYDRDWNVIAENRDPFSGYEAEVNHIGDIDIHDHHLYISAEYFMDGEGKNIQIALYDPETLTLERTFPFEAESGQLECSGIAVDPDGSYVYLCSWVGEESGRYQYR